MLDLAELIPSKDVREHLEKMKRVLSDFEKATLTEHEIEIPVEY